MKTNILFILLLSSALRISALPLRNLKHEINGSPAYTAYRETADHALLDARFLSPAADGLVFPVTKTGCSFRGKAQAPAAEKKSPAASGAIAFSCCLILLSRIACSLLLIQFN